MVSSHVKEFQNTARQFCCQIVVREVNNLAGKWIICRPKETFPKPVTCSAKTSDIESHPLGGLVVNPHICPDAFSPTRLQSAKKNWKKFTNSPGFRKYRVVASGEFKGALELVDFSGQQTKYRPTNPRKLHSDYDLLAVHKMKKSKDGFVIDRLQVKLPAGPGPDMNKQNIAAQSNRDLLKTINLELAVTQFFNKKILLPMIQHGTESTYSDFGGAAEERILIFQPGLKGYRQGRSFCSENYLNAIDEKGDGFHLWKVRNEDEVISYRSPHSR